MENHHYILTVRQLIAALSKVEDKDTHVWLSTYDIPETDDPPTEIDDPAYRVYLLPINDSKHHYSLCITGSGGTRGKLPSEAIPLITSPSLINHEN